MYEQLGATELGNRVQARFRVFIPNTALDRAQYRGVHLGRPAEFAGISYAVAVIRQGGVSWGEIADPCGCSVSTAIRAWRALAGNAP